MKSEPPVNFSTNATTFNTIGATLTSIIICTILAIIAAGSCFVYVKRMLLKQIILFSKNKDV
jgi:hypothetical protein